MLCALIKLKTWVMNYFSIAKNEESMVFKKEQVPFTPNKERLGTLGPSQQRWIDKAVTIAS